MRLGWSVTDLLQAKLNDVELSCVDCGTCPVSIQCALSAGSNGWRYACCGATAIEVPGSLLLILDCQKNTFREECDTEALQACCPLCQGDLVRSHVNGMSDRHRYVPTVHAKLPPRIRLALFKKMLPLALAEKALIDERLKG